jgi:hypothetical protein
MKSGDELDWIAVAQKMEDEEAAAAGSCSSNVGSSTRWHSKQTKED